jgi:hypothetical protein
MSTRIHLAVTATLLLVGSFSMTPGCASSDGRFDTDGTAEVSTASAASAASGGAQLWADSCGRCHNLRSPSSYSRAQWDVIVAHMRVRCSLTGEDARTIVEFLKAGAGASEEGKQ